MVLKFRMQSQACLVLITLALAMSGCVNNSKTISGNKIAIPNYSYGPLITVQPDNLHPKDTQRLVKAIDIPAQWWLLFDSPQLNQLMQLAVPNNLDLLAARAALNAAREQLNAQTALAFYPTISGQLGASKGNLFSGLAVAKRNPSNVFNGTLNFAYNLDLFGSSRSLVAALRAQAKYQEFMLAAAYLDLTTNIATASIQLALLNDSIALNKAMINTQYRQLHLLKQQMHLGAVSGSQILSQTAILAATEAKLPPLQQLRSETINLLAVLTANFPGATKLLVNISLASLHLPKSLPVSLPSQVAQQRPDISAAEALVSVASAQLGVATANLWPQFNLTASYGWSQNQLASLFSGANLVWNVGAQILQPIFNGGALRAKRRAAQANFVQATAEYRRIVCQAFAAIANVLQEVNNNNSIFADLAQAQLAAKQNLLMVRQQQVYGGASYSQLLAAESQYQQAELQLLQAQAQRFITTINLFQVLGGGWWHHQQYLTR